ncbi:MAG: glycosyltransferase [Chitinophagaceae bacterium]|nr:MAG: glycosyltransferase [Chitinophagaceae bacterium]
MAALEKMFFDVSCALAKSPGDVHFSFKNLISSPPTSLPDNFLNFIALDFSDNGTFEAASQYIKKNNITCVLCFDVQPNAKVCKLFRECGVQKIVSYWGSTMSGINHGLKLLLKKIEVFLNPNKPDHFIFESNAMREFAVQGRGISKNNTSVIPTGVDTQKFKPNSSAIDYVTNEFKFPHNAKIIFYSGHMESRKGVHVIVNSAIELVDKREQNNIYFLICGNRPGEEKPFLDTLQNHKANEHVVFAGYRNDLAKIMPGCTVGVVASTGWDSFPMSTLEMAASGLPIVVSNLQGLTETLEDGVTGFTFEPGNSYELADKIVKLLSDQVNYATFSSSSVKRIANGYSVQHQFNNLKTCLEKIFV